MSVSRREADADPDRALSSADARTYLEAPMTDAEREQVIEHARWFRRRYPTPIERLAYVRRAYARWQRTRGLAAPRYDRRAAPSESAPRPA